MPDPLQSDDPWARGRQAPKIIKGKIGQKSNQSKEKDLVILLREEGNEQVWVRIATQHCFVTRCDPMPPWEYVVRRVTIDTKTNEVIEDINVKEVDKTILHRPLPEGVDRIETRFYYEMEAISETAEAATIKEEMTESK